MNRWLVSLIVSGLCAAGILRMRDDYRDGQSRFLLWGNINPLIIRRDLHPLMFWGSMLANGALMLLLLIGALLVALRPGAGA